MGINPIGQQQNLEKKLKILLEARNSLAACITIDSIARQGAELALQRLHSQTASIFLLSKKGTLKRVKIVGKAAAGEDLSDTWFAEEEYELGESFTGAALVPRGRSPFGEPQWSNDLRSTKLAPQSQEAYREKLGELYCAIAVPLNGIDRSFGVLEVINKRPSSVNKGYFSHNNVYWLSIIGSSIADAISHLHRSSELSLLAEIGQLLVEPFSENGDNAAVYQNVANKLVDKSPYYKACVIRIGNSVEELVPVGKSGIDISWETWISSPIKKGESPAGEVFQTGKPIIREDLPLSAEDFINRGWMEENKLYSYACFPLSLRSRNVGTLSIFVGFRHRFLETDRRFIESISSLVASYAESSRLHEEIRSLRTEIESESQRQRADARIIAYESAVQDNLHTQKNDYQNLVSALNKAMAPDTSIRERERLLNEQVVWLEQRITDLSNEFNTTSHSAVNINHLTQSVIKTLSKQLQGKNITWAQLYDRDIPLIKANEREIREVIFNVISNAMKAIKEAQRPGRIEVRTGLTVIDKIEYLQVIVEDTGIGIPAENSENIFQRNFSAYKGGTGMGLFIARQILDRYGGKMSFKSTVGRGTTFTLNFPRKRLQA